MFKIISYILFIVVISALFIRLIRFKKLIEKDMVALNPNIVLANFMKALVIIHFIILVFAISRDLIETNVFLFSNGLLFFLLLEFMVSYNDRKIVFKLKSYHVDKDACLMLKSQDKYNVYVLGSHRITVYKKHRKLIKMLDEMSKNRLT